MNESFYGIDLKKGNGQFGRPRPRERNRIYGRPLWLIAVKERMLEFYSDWITHFISTLALDVIQVRDSGNYFHLRRHKFLACVKPLSRFLTASG